MIKNIIKAFLLIYLVSSCTSQKQLVYLQDVDSLTTENVYFRQQVDYKIQNQDILYIRILSIDDRTNDLINVASTRYQQNLFQNETSLFINGYSVDNSGNVELPIIGKVFVLNKTVEEAKDAIREKTDQYLRNASVIVKLISFKFTVLGEVNRPGVYKNFNNQLTVLEAIGMAGDISDYGNRTRILVIRPTKNETRTYRIDLTKKDVLSSEGFFLLPNDIVYVEPIKSKTFRINIPTLSLFLSTLTTLILVLNFIK
ncbi:MAG: sugar transporter [Bacteroidetes bacterium]|nr:sugar transporter [Bacteroidota bacterium]